MTRDGVPIELRTEILPLANKKILFFMLLLLIGIVSAVPTTEVLYFYSTTCSHCVKITESGVLNNISSIEGVTLNKYEITSPINRERYLGYVDKSGIKNAGIPFLVIERGSEFSYLMGDGPIIEDAEDAIVNFRGHEIGNIDIVDGKLTLGIVLLSALIDSINPCAFGVLLFLMSVLLSMGSAKRALRSGLIYTFVIFVVYLAAGFGIMRWASDFLALENVKFFIGAVILIMAGLEFKDFFWEGKGFSLRIPVSAKPALERYVHKGTLTALIVLGMLVALVELPCTGGIYLAILSLISSSGNLGIIYLVLYNFIFILPLILITYTIYRGIKIDAVNDWVQRNKRFMRLSAGLIMLFLGLNLLGII
jgi:cytochrome c biogenesis protein CcdA